MDSEQKDSYANITLTDLQLAAAYYPILIGLAKSKQQVTYGDLVDMAKSIYTGNSVVQSAIAVSAGRRLNVVRMFTRERGLPDITSLVVGKSKGECGDGFTRSFDPVAVRETVFSFDWSGVSSDFDGFVASAEVAIKPRKRIKEPEAAKNMYDYYNNNRNSLPQWIEDHRDVLIDLIMEGFSAEEAFIQVVAEVQQEP